MALFVISVLERSRENARNKYENNNKQKQINREKNRVLGEESWECFLLLSCEGSARPVPASPRGPHWPLSDPGPRPTESAVQCPV